MSQKRVALLTILTCFLDIFFCYSRYLKDFLQLQTSNHYRSFELFRSNKIIKMSKLDSYSSMSLFLTALYTSLLKQSAFLHKNNVIYMAASVSRKCNILCIKFKIKTWHSSQQCCSLSYTLESAFYILIEKTNMHDRIIKLV